jgi:hypothetical protein
MKRKNHKPRGMRALKGNDDHLKIVRKDLREVVAMVDARKAGTVASRAGTPFFMRPVTGIIGGVSGLVSDVLSDVSDFIGSIPNELGVCGTGNRKCPFCAERIKRQAIRCRYCGSDLTDYEERGD